MRNQSCRGLWIVLMVSLFLGACRSQDCIGDIPSSDQPTPANSGDGQASPNDESNPSLNKIPPKQQTPAELIIAAVEEGDLPKVTAMLADNAELLNAKDETTGASLLITAVNFNKLVLAQYLVEAGIDTTLTDNEGNDAEFYARQLGNEVLTAIISGELTGDNLDAAFLTEVEKSNLESLAFLLELGADINAADPESAGRTALIIAIGKGEVELIRFLLENGINTTITARGREMPASDYARRTRATAEVIAVLEEFEATNP